MRAAAATSLACQQRGDIPLLALVAFALIEPVRASGRSTRRRIAVITAAGVLCASIILVTDLVTIGYAFAWHVIKAPKADETTRIAAAPLHGLIFPRAETPNATARDVRLSINQHDPKLVFPFYTSWQYAMLVNDGLAVLRGRTSADTAVLCLDFTDPFTFALNLRPVRGGEIFWFSTTPRHFPNTAELLSKADLVMAPKRPVYVPAGEAVIAQFTPPLRRDFRLLAESDYWHLYKRRVTASN
jgi:hypothetical protein